MCRSFIIVFLISSSVLGQTIRTYTELPMATKILNPERGHDASWAIVPPWAALTASQLNAERNTDSLTVHYAVFDLTNYRDGLAISVSDLNVIRQSFWAAHQAGMKLLLRFTYCSSGCTGMSEPPIDSCVKHIKQVMSIVRDSVALVASVCGGWMGYWGEWDYGLSPSHWDTLIAPRQRIIDTTLAYLPGTLQYSIGQAYHLGNSSFTRYGLAGFQWNWQSQVNGIPTDTLTFTQAWDSTYKRSRVGYNIDGWLLGYNDGYNDDGGMFYVYPRCGHEPPCPSGTWDGATYIDANYGKPWWNRNSRFFTNYGEVCGGGAGVVPNFNVSNWLEHGRDFHLTYFPFSPNTCYDWKSLISSCWDTTFNKLGYRISVVNDTIPTSINQGDTLIFKVTLKNRGWATPAHPRKLYAVLRRSSGGYTRVNAVQSWDWRNLMIPTAIFGQSNGSPAQHTFTFKAFINPSTIPAGDYSIGIWAPDYYSELQNDSRYSIRFANMAGGNYSWEDSTGINNLGATISVTDNPPCDSNHYSVSPSSLSFGDVDISCNASRSVIFTILAGCYPSIIAAVSDDSNFTVFPTSARIGSTDSIFVVTFSPSDSGIHNGNIIFTISGGGSPITLPVDGKGQGTGHANRIEVSYHALNWQIISLPVRGNCPVVSPGLYGYNGQYILSDTLVNGKGFWKRVIDSSQSYVGFSITRDTIDLNSEWNLIGSLSVDEPVGNIYPDSLISSRYFGYSNGYYPSDTLEAGRGYWVKSSIGGQIVLDTTKRIQKHANLYDVLKSMNEIIIRDAKNNEEILYFGSYIEPLLLDRYELPPMPPEGNFDVRFLTGRFLEVIQDSEQRDFPIQISSAVYPVTIRWELHQPYTNASLRLGGNEIVLRENGETQIVEPQQQVVLNFSGKNEPPQDYALVQNYPNPFNPVTTIKYQLPVESKISLTIYNILGQVVQVLIEGVQSAGYKSATWNANNFPDGVYFYRLDAISKNPAGKSFTQVRKMLLIK